MRSSRGLKASPPGWIRGLPPECNFAQTNSYLRIRATQRGFLRSQSGTSKAEASRLLRRIAHSCDGLGFRGGSPCIHAWDNASALQKSNRLIIFWALAPGLPKLKPSRLKPGNKERCAPCEAWKLYSRAHGWHFRPGTWLTVLIQG